MLPAFAGRAHRRGFVMRINSATAVACFALAASHLPSDAHANPRVADYPAKPVRMVIPLAPGGGSDIVGRVVALALSDRWGKPVVVDNRPGAGSVVGTAIVARAPADGYTLLVSSSSLAISPALYRHLDYDVQRDLAGVTLIASQASLLVVHASVRAKSLKELIALAQARPDRLSYASAGVGSATHLGTELLLHAAHVQLQHVPYKSAGQATTAVLSGEAQVLLTNMASVLPHLDAGRLRALGVSSLKRSPLAPDVPTLNESGLGGFEYATWYGMMVPARTPKALVATLHDATAQVLKSGSVRERLAAQGLQTYALPPAQFERYLHGEIERWNGVIKTARITID